MRTFLGCILFSLALSSCATTPIAATRLEKANVLPLSLNDHFQIRKVKLYYYGDQPIPRTTSEPVIFERQYIEYGMVDNIDRQARQGNYFQFFWRTSEQADVTVRLEYRQAALGNYVMAQERYYPQAKGSFRSDFSVIGDAYLESGRVTSWRILLIVDGRIVAFRQSFIWK